MPMKKPAEVTCDFAGSLVPPGDYLAYCAQAFVYRDPGFKRWTCLLRFDLLDASGFNVVARGVPLWFNLGKRDKAHTSSRRSKYLKAWLAANNGATPKRRDRLPHSVFLKRIAKVRVENAETELPYSVVREILSWETGVLTHISNQQSTIKEGIPEEGEKKAVLEIACQSQRESEKEKRAIGTDDAPVNVSVLAGIESQHNTTQGREAVKSLPQRHCIPTGDRAERLAQLRVQASQVMARFQEQCKTDASACGVRE